jgi:hypothetical protein
MLSKLIDIKLCSHRDATLCKKLNKKSRLLKFWQTADVETPALSGPRLVHLSNFSFKNIVLVIIMRFTYFVVLIANFITPLMFIFHGYYAFIHFLEVMRDFSRMGISNSTLIAARVSMVYHRFHREYPHLKGYVFIERPEDVKYGLLEHFRLRSIDYGNVAWKHLPPSDPSSSEIWYRTTLGEHRDFSDVLDIPSEYFRTEGKIVVQAPIVPAYYYEELVTVYSSRPGWAFWLYLKIMTTPPYLKTKIAIVKKLGYIVIPIALLGLHIFLSFAAVTILSLIVILCVKVYFMAQSRLDQ